MSALGSITHLFSGIAREVKSPSKTTLLAGLGLATSICHFGLSSPSGVGLGLSCAGVLAKKAWNWKNAPVHILPERHEVYDEENLALGIDELYDDIVRCGLKGGNRETAQRRNMSLFMGMSSHSAHSCAFQRLGMLSSILLRNDDTPTLQTLSYDLDRLCAEMAQQGLSKNTVFQTRWNELFEVLHNLSQEEAYKHEKELNKLYSLRLVLESRPLSTETVFFMASFMAQRLAHEIEQKGARSDLSGFTQRYQELHQFLSGIDARSYPFGNKIYRSMEYSRDAILTASILQSPNCADSLPLLSPPVFAASTAATQTSATAASSSSASFLRLIGEFSLTPDTVEANLLDPNKQLVYDQLTTQRQLHEPLHFAKYQLANAGDVQALPLFVQERNVVHARAGSFSYDPSTEQQMHWTANFADPQLFGYSQGPRLLQDELQVAEHPPLAHLRTYLEERPHLSTINSNQVALISNVQRFGELDITVPISNGPNIYGYYFADASNQDIANCLTRFNEPRASNIFAFVAPRTGSANQHYDYLHLKLYYERAFLAFKTIKDKHATDTREVVIHTGNRECGEFGNNNKAAALIQLAAARAAGVRMIYYPLGDNQAFQDARLLFQQMEELHSHFTVGEFLHHLADNATAYGLRYGQSNSN